VRVLSGCTETRSEPRGVLISLPAGSEYAWRLAQVISVGSVTVAMGLLWLSRHTPIA
jgi:hypothetical protein